MSAGIASYSSVIWSLLDYSLSVTKTGLSQSILQVNLLSFHKCGMQLFIKFLGQPSVYQLLQSICSTVNHASHK